ncbi:F-box and DUF domain containing protein [Musa troglodytarum]|uniref:F-box and DUF domain containing protein n=1 Tax=Musa troglodytarum TaxID=320322 RepID=A0A9E7GQT0_9LILI|nr:F-box and DUF domain containing protein [Musa troglodytarum]
MADWSKLSIDISSLIHGELSVLDYIRVGAVCKQWNFACKLKYHCPTKKPQSPWLVLPDECDTTTIKFFSILEKKTYKIPCPEPMIHRRAYIGSGHGWLVTVNDTCSMHLLNPLTGAQIPLPPVTTLPFVSAHHNSHGQIIEFVVEVPYGANIISTLVFSFERMRCIFFQKAVLSAVPDVGDNCLIMMICNNWKHLVIGRAGGEAWKCISIYHHYTNIIHRKGKFHTISDTGIVKHLEIGLELV